MSTVEEFIHDGLPYKIRSATAADGRYNALFACPRCNLASVSCSYVSSREALDAAIAGILEHHLECRARVLV
jgi:transcription elongation factor Elf1